MSQSLFSVRNELPAEGGDGGCYLELNPAVVASDEGQRFALSAVWVGPPFAGDDDRLSLEVRCDGDRAVLDAVHHQSEATGTDECLTVALFSVSRAFLELLAAGREVRIGLGAPVARQSRALDQENRSNLLRFLDLVGAQDGTSEFPAGAVA